MQPNKKKGPCCVLLAQTDKVKRNGSNLWQILHPKAQIRDTVTDRQRLKEKERRKQRAKGRRRLREREREGETDREIYLFSETQKKNRFWRLQGGIFGFSGHP